MTHIVEFPAFILKKGVSVSEFLPVAEKFHREFVSKQKGYISHKLLVSGDKWYDLVTWESMEDTENAFKAIHTLKGVAGNLGMSVIHDDVCALTEILRVGSLDGAKEKYVRIKIKYDELIEIIAKYQ